MGPVQALQSVVQDVAFLEKPRDLVYQLECDVLWHMPGGCSRHPLPFWHVPLFWFGSDFLPLLCSSAPPEHGEDLVSDFEVWKLWICVKFKFCIIDECEHFCISGTPIKRKHVSICPIRMKNVMEIVRSRHPPNSIAQSYQSLIKTCSCMQATGPAPCQGAIPLAPRETAPAAEHEDGTQREKPC